MASRDIVLVSGSPRRRELMAQMGFEFIVDSKTSFKEIVPSGMAPDEVPAYFAKGKVEGWSGIPMKDQILIGADTVVICDDEIMGKPKDEADAFRMLRKLSGRVHRVVSAVCVKRNDVSLVKSDTATVHFRPLSDEQIHKYIADCRPLDKAGAYGIQESIGLLGIDRIEGSFYTIMGLPTHLLHPMIEEVEKQGI